MVKFQFILLVLVGIKVYAVYAHGALKVDNNEEAEALERLKKTGLTEQEIKDLGLTIDQVDRLSKQREDASIHEICPIFLPDYKARTNLTRTQHLRIHHRIVLGPISGRNDIFVLWKDILCPYTNNPETYECFEKSLGLAMEDYFEFLYIQSQNVSSLQSRIFKALRLCAVLLVPRQIVTRESLESLRKFNDVELEQFVELWDQSQTSSRRTDYEHLCKLVNNITIPPVEQGNLYNERDCSKIFIDV